MKKNTLWKRLKKHYILFMVGSLAFILTIFLGLYKVIHSHRATPIAHIDPADSVKTTSLPGKLERYKKELIEQEKEAYKRKIALDEIISMDFSQEMKIAQHQKSKDTSRSIKPLENTFEKEKIKEAELPKVSSGKISIQNKVKTKQPSAEKQKALSSFYTIKADTHELESGEKVSSATFAKAIIHGNQKVRGGGIVCLRLLEEAFFGSHTYPKNTILYGRVRGGMSGRVQITVLQPKDSKVNLSVYDQDYSEGIAYQMRETVNEIARESRDDALNEALSSLPYGGVAGGIAQLGKNVMKRTKRPPTIYLADGYQIFIANTK